MKKKTVTTAMTQGEELQEEMMINVMTMMMIITKCTKLNITSNIKTKWGKR
jgi:hypothetical protein